MEKPRITFLGAAGTVSGSCSLVEYSNTRILIDYGTIQGHGYQAAPNRSFPDLSPINAIIMTHGHLDHIGEIPAFVRDGFSGPIFGQYATCEIARIIWEDSARLGASESPLSHYGNTAVKKAVSQLLYLEYRVPFTVGDMRLQFFDAGHILGSSHVMLEAGDSRILFSGDIGPVNTPIICDPCINWEKPVNTVVIESTYGDRLHRERESTVAEFGKIVERIITQKRGTAYSRLCNRKNAGDSLSFEYAG